MGYVSKKKAEKALHEVYTKWYEASSPKASYDELLEHYVPMSEYHIQVFNAYFLEQDTMHAIAEEVRKAYKMPKHDWGWVFLGAGPLYMPKWADETEENKFKTLLEKIDRGDEITLEDLPETDIDARCRKNNCSEREYGYRELIRLYEYNRKTHPEAASKYLEMYVDKKFNY